MCEVCRKNVAIIGNFDRLLHQIDSYVLGAADWRANALVRRLCLRMVRIALTFAPSTSKQGVKNRVNRVVNAKPPAMALANCVHHCVEGAPKDISLEKKLMFMDSTIGIKPSMVVRAVRNTGRARTEPVSMAASNADEPALRNLLYEKCLIQTIELGNQNNHHKEDGRHECGNQKNHGLLLLFGFPLEFYGHLRVDRTCQ